MSVWDSLFGTRYPLFGFGQELRAMTAEEILHMQLSQQVAMQNMSQPPLSYILGLAQYRPFQRPLDERFADFKIRLAAAIERQRLKWAK